MTFTTVTTPDNELRTNEPRINETPTEMNLAMEPKLPDNNSPDSESVVDSIKQHFEGDLHGKRIAVWGLTTHSLSSQRIGSGSIEVVRWLVEEGATVAVHDAGVPNAAIRLAFGNTVEVCNTQWQAANRAAAVIVGTDCDSYTYIDAGFLCWHVAEAVLFDVLNCVELGSNPANVIQHVAFNGNETIGRRELVRFPDTRPSNLSQWQNRRASAAG